MSNNWFIIQQQYTHLQGLLYHLHPNQPHPAVLACNLMQRGRYELYSYKMYFTLFGRTLLISLLSAHIVPPSEFITSLSRKISTRTQLIYCAEYNVLCNQLIKQLDAPKLSLNGNHTVKLKGFYHSDTLVIVLLARGSTAQQAQLGSLRKMLQGWQYTHILFIYVPLTDEEHANTSLVVSSTAPRTWHWLFDWCWSNGFLKVLLLQSWSQTAVELLTYTPFPHFRVHHTTLSKYLQAVSRTPNLQGMPIRAGIGNNPPRTILYRDQDGEVVLKGMIPELLRLFAARYNATLVLSEPPVPPNNTYEPKFCIFEVLSGNLDLCADAFLATELIPTTHPVFIYMGYLLVRFPRSIPRYRYFFTPFSSYVWLLLVSTIVFVIAFTTIIGRLQSGAWRFEYFMLEVVRSFLQTAFELALISGRLQPFLSILLTVSGFVISSIYLTCLSSILTTEVYERPIESFEDLHALKIPVLVSDIDNKYIPLYGIPSIVEELFEVKPVAEINAYRNSLDPNYAQLLIFDKCQLSMYRQRFLLRPRAVILDIPVETACGGIPMKENFPFKALLDLHILHIFDHGLFWHVSAVSMEDSVRYGNLTTFQTEYREVKPLNMEFFQMPALLLACGCTLSLICFFAEIIVHRLRNL